MKNYNERDCIAALNKKQCCRISGNLIEVSKDNYDVGLKSWAKISYLCKVHGYRYMITAFSSTGKSKVIKRNNDEVDERKVGKMNKKGNNASFMKQLKTMINL